MSQKVQGAIGNLGMEVDAKHRTTATQRGKSELVLIIDSTTNFYIVFLNLMLRLACAGYWTP
jgi:hypothetical protein